MFLVLHTIVLQCVPMGKTVIFLNGSLRWSFIYIYKYIFYIRLNSNSNIDNDKNVEPHVPNGFHPSPLLSRVLTIRSVRANLLSKWPIVFPSSKWCFSFEDVSFVEIFVLRPFARANQHDLCLIMDMGRGMLWVNCRQNNHGHKASNIVSFPARTQQSTHFGASL